MIGVDVVEIARIERLLERFGERALERFLSPPERVLATTPSTTAGFWALKEAVAKALGCGIGSEFGFYDVRIQKSQKGAPKILLARRIIKRYDLIGSEVSITHDGGLAIAVALLHTSNQPTIEGF